VGRRSRSSAAASAAQLDARQLLAGGAVEAAALLASEPLALDLEHAQGVVEQLGVLVLDGGVEESAAALEEAGGAGGLAQDERARRRAAVGPRQLEKSDGRVVMTVGLEQLGRLVRRHGAGRPGRGRRGRPGGLPRCRGRGAGGDAAWTERRLQRAVDRQPLLAGLDRQPRRLPEVAELGVGLGGLPLVALARVDLGALPGIAHELGREAGPRNHAACDSPNGALCAFLWGCSIEHPAGRGQGSSLHTTRGFQGGV
jgi:hypothetical protein